MVKDTKKRLYRNEQEKVIGGVCAGIADYFELDPVLIRAIYILAMFITGVIPLLIAYLVLWIIIPIKKN